MNRNILTAALALALMTACSGDDEVNQVNLAVQAQQRWTQLDIIDYTYEIKVACECLTEPHIRVVVEADTVASAVHVENGAPVVAGQGLLQPYTIDQYFDWIIDQLRSRPPQTSIEFDPEYYYPALFFIDTSGQLVDDELTYRITLFQPTP